MPSSLIKMSDSYKGKAVSEGFVRLIFIYTGLSIKVLPYLKCIYGNLDIWSHHTPIDIATCLKS